jgi:hypothetical protein
LWARREDLRHMRLPHALGRQALHHLQTQGDPMRYRLKLNRPLHLRSAAHLETSGPLGQDARELAERCGASVEDVEAALAVLVETGDVEPIGGAS